MSYADAINAAIAQAQQELRQYGRLLAQAELPIPVDEHPQEELDLIEQGYLEQLDDFPNG